MKSATLTPSTTARVGGRCEGAEESGSAAMSGIGYADVERICDELSDLESLDVGVAGRGSVHVRGKLRPDRHSERADALIAFERSASGLVEALEVAGWHCVETSVELSIGTHAGARWTGRYQLALEDQKRTSTDIGARP